MKVEEQKVKSTDYIKAEIPIIEKMIRDETWYEGERRGCKVDPEDKIVMKKVCKIIKKCDKDLKKLILGSLVKS